MARPAVIVTACLLAAMTVWVGCAPPALLITPVSSSMKLREKEVLRESLWASKKLALIEIDGVIANRARTSLLGIERENPVALLVEKLDKAAEDDLVRGVLLRINSPGGGVTASDLMYQELRRFRERSGKPVVAYLMDVAASGGYYVACAADRIVAHPTSVTGSIGVVMIAPDVSGTMQKLGIRANVIKSGPLKDAGSPLREMSESERAVFQAMIDQMYERFLAVVQAARPDVPAEKLRAVADGRVYAAPQALELGLIDAVGSIHDALVELRLAARLADEKIVVVEYARPVAHRANVYARAPDPPATLNLLQFELPWWLAADSPQMLYLWAPAW